MSQNLSSAAVVIGALRDNNQQDQGKHLMITDIDQVNEPHHLSSSPPHPPPKKKQQQTNNNNKKQKNTHTPRSMLSFESEIS